MKVLKFFASILYCTHERSTTFPINRRYADGALRGTASQCCVVCGAVRDYDFRKMTVGSWHRDVDSVSYGKDWRVA